jgi:uncharacterized membrane protein
MLSEIYEAVFRLLSLFCHQLPERSLFVFGVQFPLCVRCAALLAGALGTVAHLVFRLPIPSHRLSFALTLPMAVEITLSSFGLAGSSNLARGMTGLLFGFFFPMGSMVWLARMGRGTTNPRPPSCPGAEAS